MTVTPDDVAIELDRDTLSQSDSVRFERWIANARLLIKAKLGPVEFLDQELLDYVVLQAVAAHARRPDDATQVSVSVDDGNVAKTYRSSAGRVEILPEWWNLLSPESSGGKRAFSFQPHGSNLPQSTAVINMSAEFYDLMSGQEP